MLKLRRIEKEEMHSNELMIIEYKIYGRFNLYVRIVELMAN